MDKKIIIEYSNDAFTIECDGEQLDVERISGVDISEWSIPFWIDNTRWNGLYDELKDFCGCNEYTVIFHGTDENLTALKQVFHDKPVKIVGQNNKVIIIYDRDKLTTKMTINGKIFDTSRITDKKIEEWVVPFSNNGIEWKGIFAEIEDFIGTNTYAIQFMGNTDDMRIIMDNSPGGINITYKTPVASKKRVTPVPSKSTVTAPAVQPAQSIKTSQQIKSGEYTFKDKVIGLLLGAKEEFIKLKTEDNNLFLFGVISLALVVVARFIQMIFIKESILIQLTIFPVAAFSVFAYKKDYKMLAVAALVSVLLFSYIAYTIYVQRDIARTFDEADEAFDDALDALDEYNDLMNDYNNAINGS